ncbi:hypothetical protein RDSD_001691 [Oleidesulfovibrio alaskensis]
MSILQIKHCTACGKKTYHRFYDALKNRYVCRSYWECLDCRTRSEQPHDKGFSSGCRMAPDTGK